MSKYKIIADMHTHTIRSTDANSTLYENIQIAKQKGLKCIAITDHSDNLNKETDRGLLKGLLQLPDTINGIHIYKGIEVNIMGLNSIDIDTNTDVLEKLDWIIVSYHPTSGYIAPSSEILTNTYLGLLNNPYVMCLGHSNRYGYIYDYEKVISEYRNQGRLIELDNKISSDKEKQAFISIANTCKKLNAPIILNSNAHYCEDVGEIGEASEILSSIDFPNELIINSNEELLNSYLEKYKTWLREQDFKIGLRRRTFGR